MSQNFSRQVPLNLLSNMGVFILNIIINLFMTPFYIKYVGVDGLGVIRLALLLPVYINLATLVISGAVSRFLTIDLQEKKHVEANITFNTSFFSLSTILIVVTPFIVFFALHITSFLNIPELFSAESRYLFLGVFISSQITIFTTLFLLPAYAVNRLDIQNYIRIVTLFVQTSLIIGIFVFVSSNIAYVGYIYIFSGVVGLLLSLYVWQEFAPFLKLGLSYVRVEKFKEIASIGSWMVFNQMGSILFLSVDLIIINYFFTASLTGEYSIVLQWSIMIRTLGGVISSVVTPVVFIHYANKNFEKLVEIMTLSIRYIGIVIAIIIGLVMGFAYPLFNLWLGSGYDHLVPLLWLMIGYLVNLSTLSLFPIEIAFNKVKVPAIVTFFLGLTNIVLAVFFAVGLDMSLYGIALAGLITTTLKNSIFTPIYASMILNIKVSIFFKEMLKAPIMLFLVFVLSYAISLQDIHSWFALILNVLLALGISLGSVWYVVLSKGEQKYLINILERKKDKEDE